MAYYLNLSLMEIFVALLMNLFKLLLLSVSFFIFKGIGFFITDLLWPISRPWLNKIKSNGAIVYTLDFSTMLRASIAVSSLGTAGIYISRDFDTFVFIPLLALVGYNWNSDLGAAILGTVTFSAWYSGSLWTWGLSKCEMIDAMATPELRLKVEDDLWRDIVNLAGLTCVAVGNLILLRVVSSKTKQHSSIPKTKQHSSMPKTYLLARKESQPVLKSDYFCKETELYAPLIGNQIRLLTLFPDKPEAKVRAGLSILRDGVLGSGFLSRRAEISGTTTPASKYPSPLEFEALSYVWGDTNRNRSVTLGLLQLADTGNPTKKLEPASVNEDFPVTKNLEVALRMLRHQTMYRRLWVDALCVNQDDIAERSSQVQHMKMVYECSSRTIAWLGESNNYTVPAMKVIQNWSQDKHLKLSLDESSRFNSVFMNPYTKWSLFSLSSVRDLMQRPWWYRIWTVQELIIPRDVLLICGQQKVSWHQLVAAKENLMRHYRTCCAISARELPSSGFDVILEFINTIEDLEMYRSRGKDTSLGHQDLLSLCAAFRHRLATDYRDKVFGLLSLANDSSAIIPDYAADVAQIYKEVMRSHVAKTNTLQGLSYIVETERNQDLPSWVADWGHPPQNWVLQMDRIIRWNLYNACLMPKIAPSMADSSSMATAEPCADFADSISNNHEILQTKGWIVDEVIKINQQMILDSPNAIINHIYILHQDILVAGTECSEPYSGGGTKESAFWGTLIMDTMLPVAERRKASNYSSRVFHRARPRTWGLCPAWWTQENKSDHDLQSRAISQEIKHEIPPDGAHEIRHTLETAMARRRFFVTREGFFGLGPERLDVGDRICVLKGCRVPVVLRSCTEDHGDSEGDSGVQVEYRTFVGDCYVHGIMDGQAVKGRKDEITTIRIK